MLGLHVRHISNSCYIGHLIEQNIQFKVCKKKANTFFSSSSVEYNIKQTCLQQPKMLQFLQGQSEENTQCINLYSQLSTAIAYAQPNLVKNTDKDISILQ